MKNIFLNIKRFFFPIEDTILEEPNSSPIDNSDNHELFSTELIRKTVLATLKATACLSLRMVRSSPLPTNLKTMKGSYFIFEPL